MSVILILIVASLALAAGFLGGFIWAVRSGQYEDTWTPGLRPLMDEAGRRQALPKTGRAAGEETEKTK